MTIAVAIDTKTLGHWRRTNLMSVYFCWGSKCHLLIFVFSLSYCILMCYCTK